MLLATWPSAFAATFTVTNGNDAGPGSLRQAVFDADVNPGKDTIVIDSGVTTIKPIALKSGGWDPIQIFESVDIIGPGGPPFNRVTVDDMQSYFSRDGRDLPGWTRCDAPGSLPIIGSDIVFEVGQQGQDNSAIEVLFQGFRVTRTGGLVFAHTGAGIRLRDMVVDNNRADFPNCQDRLIFAGGSLEIVDSILGNNLKEQNDPSALIAVLGPSLRIENSVLDFKENKTLFAFEGGASNGLGGKTVEILDSVIAVGVAGATSTAMRFENSDVSITNSKLIGSLSGFCGPLVEARQNTQLALTNVTMFADGRPCPVEPDSPALLGVFSGSQLNVVNTLLFRRTFGNLIDPATRAPAVTVSGATIARSTNNFADDPAVPAILGGTATGDPGLLLNGYACNFTQFPPGNPDCDPVPGSPLIDTGDSLLAVDPRTGNPLTIDLRRNPRIDGAAVDIGALERQQAAGSITIVKQATPKDGTNFNFILGGPSIVQQNFTVDDAAPDDNDGIGASKTVASLIPGTYLLSEQSVAGWHLEGIICTSDRPGSAPAITLPSVSIALHEAERVTCTFANQKQGSLTVVKKALGGDDTFNFGSNTLIPDSFPLTTTTGAAQITYNNLAPGRYDVGESTPPTGWTVAAATCDNGDDPGAIDIAPGANVTCTFENHKQNTIIIVKRAIGGDSTFNFTGGALGNFGLTTVNGEAVQAFGGLSTGTYSVAETASAGWTATVADPVCSNGNNASTINLASGQIVVCVFLSVAQDALVVEKKALGGDATFSFTSSSNAIGNFSLTTVNGGALRAFNSLPSGQYSVTETALPTGWDLTGNTCSSGVTLSPGGLATCTFTNTQRGAINIVKRTASGDGTFSFTSVTLGNFNLTTSGTAATQHFPNLRPGIYSVSENAQAGWEQSTATCSDGSSPTAIQLDPGETVTCTFTSAQDGRLIVVKNTLGGDATFAFTSTVSGHSSFNLTTANGTAASTFSDVKPGTYTVQEQPLAGWDSVSAQCSNGNKPDAVTLAAGQTVTCTFTNARKGTLVIRANTKNGDATFDFASRTLPQAAFALTTINGAASTQFNDLSNLKIYDITQTAPAGWVLLSATCDNGDLPGAVSIRSGATVICTFANRKANDIPTLSQWGLLVLAALLAFGAWSHGTMRSAGRR
ncbi:MAG TPA: IPTL-CTERM sorting domain-containing protein [Candidatus Competibacter sp.]|nr:IPTL-CTERM sorting domain-containing protein [Candidatus Competibacter sp.]